MLGRERLEMRVIRGGEVRRNEGRGSRGSKENEEYGSRGSWG